ncbi:hypothetical protein JB92DRAFT_2953149 [Gautieria morchelliformis]|nr:hypothetical protein JB92DRAFT_2953149 [Gautieria morchelliformis]
MPAIYFYAAVRSTEHIKFDNYAVFAITGSDETLDRLTGLLTESNKRWQKTVNEYGPQEPRPLVSDILNDVEFDIVLLHPDYFVVPGQHISYYNRPGVSPPDGQAYVVDKELVAGDPPSRFPPFRHVSTRGPSQTVNIFFFILNAGAKFRHHETCYGFGNISERAKGLVDKTLQLVELIYFRPALNGVEIGAELAAGDDSSVAYPINRGNITGFTSQGMQGTGSDDEAQDTEGDLLTDDADIILTNDDMDEVFRRLDDPSLSPMERFDLSCTFMFPTAYETPHSVRGLPEPPSVFDRLQSMSSVHMPSAECS